MTAHTKSTQITAAEARKSLSYDHETGKLVWLVAPAKNIKAGTEAGCFKGKRPNKKAGGFSRYMYVKYNGFDIPAARLAWLLHYGEWPSTNVLFKDGCSDNLRIENLRLSTMYREVRALDGSQRRVMTRAAQRHYGLKRYYGMSLPEYEELLKAQSGVCAICERMETATLGKVLKPLAVDHCHTTGNVRGLLCTNCNALLGHSRDNVATLTRAIAYLKSHAVATEAPGNIIPLLQRSR